jgi:hypothetical protein
MENFSASVNAAAEAASQYRSAKMMLLPAAPALQH